MDSPEHGSTSTKQRLTLGLVVSFMAKHATRVSKKLKPKPKPKPKDQFGLRSGSPPRFFASPKSPLKSTKPKQLLTTISNKAIKFVHRKRNGRDAEAEAEEGGIWQKAILMGDKCQPLDFSGVIYYDSKGNQVEPRSCLSAPHVPVPCRLTLTSPPNVLNLIT
ncbi:hypothetical protein V6N13_021715 [Hibiscus sabdariffa]|uniref:Uncharacterized protein n=1 Tax=Hibiscus sabdariffa TaxID=183260 RepID=A0ABR2BAJ2_9ROSI